MPNDADRWPILDHLIAKAVEAIASQGTPADAESTARVAVGATLEGLARLSDNERRHLTIYGKPEERWSPGYWKAVLEYLDRSLTVDAAVEEGGTTLDRLDRLIRNRGFLEAEVERLRALRPAMTGVRLGGVDYRVEHSHFLIATGDETTGGRGVLVDGQRTWGRAGNEWELTPKHVPDHLRPSLKRRVVGWPESVAAALDMAVAVLRYLERTQDETDELLMHSAHKDDRADAERRQEARRREARDVRVTWLDPAPEGSKT